MKPIHVKSTTCIDSSQEVNNEDPKFKIGDIVRISKYKNVCVKGYTSDLSEETFVIKRVKNTVPRTYAINDLNGEKNFWNVLRKRTAKSKLKRV